jgi:hypothetical protein
LDEDQACTSFEALSSQNVWLLEVFYFYGKEGLYMKISMVCRVLLTLVVIGNLVLSSPRQAKGSDSALNVMTIKT